MARILPIVYWATTVATAALFAVPGAALVAEIPHFAAEMGRLGYPGYFLLLLGAFKVAGAAVILAPRLPILKNGHTPAWSSTSSAPWCRACRWVIRLRPSPCPSPSASCLRLRGRCDRRNASFELPFPRPHEGGHKQS